MATTNQSTQRRDEILKAITEYFPQPFKSNEEKRFFPEHDAFDHVELAGISDFQEVMLVAHPDYELPSKDLVIAWDGISEDHVGIVSVKITSPSQEKTVIIKYDNAADDIIVEGVEPELAELVKKYLFCRAKGHIDWELCKTLPVDKPAFLLYKYTIQIFILTYLHKYIKSMLLNQIRNTHGTETIYIKKWRYYSSPSKTKQW